jgi:seryl-tRNA synthetase
MPIDINLFRADKGGDPELIKESQRRRFASVELVDEIIEKDSQWRRMTGDIDHMKKERNAVQKEVGQKKKAKQECEEQVQYIKKIGEDILATEKAQVEIKAEIDAKVRLVGNIVDMGVKVSQDEDADNEVVSTWGTPRDPAGLLNHHDLLWRIGGYEPERGVAVAGHRGYFLKDMGVMLNQAFINYGIAFLRKKEYSILQPPYMMKKSVMSGVAQLEQFDEELYKVSSGTSEDNYLIATSEQPICGFHMGEWIEEKSLPLKYSGVSTCFRKEAGSHGKDTWGIFRVHQFEKVEQFVIVEGDLETSKKMQEQMSAVAEEFYQSLGFPYQVISIVTGALNNAAIKKLDLECWFPGYNAYRELVSCSNCTDYQSRSMEIRCGQKKLGDREKKYVHMLNSTLCATGRAICCLLETYQVRPNCITLVNY